MLPQPPLLAAQPHRNQQLFSDHYLNAILPSRPGWHALHAEAAPAMQAIRALYDSYRPGNEAQTEHDLIRPVLAQLGHTFEVQASLWTPDGVVRPDYVFFRDQAALDVQRGKQLNADALRSAAIAIGDAKPWDLPLDKTTKRGTATENPVKQVALYMQHSRLAWGILTNGRLWRLFHRDTIDRRDHFYEVDLPALVDSGDPGAFLYFYAFFRRAAFESHALGLDAILRESADYAHAIGDSLKQQVYDALLHLAQGLLDFAPNRLQPDPATLKQIYDNALIVLYRLLFIFYAEARELLPVGANTQYRDSYSLRAISRDVAHAIDGGRPLLRDVATLWPRLRTLFHIINGGNPGVGVATFNGGLFDPQRHPFLEQYAVGDERLQGALDMLARVADPATGERHFVDYRDLSVRHLGTIYEGLLEYHLESIPDDDAGARATTNVGARRAVPLRDDQFTLRLLNDRGERKATGSYYTPDYVVKYIVERAVGPVLEAAVAGATDDRARLNAVLSVNVLDPAMGSGHFLVEATEFIARFLLDQGLTADAERLTADDGESDLQGWKRRVAQSCIYGVDLNPLAVDLAKLSLWLSTVAQDRPLSFLDHHLRAGNALVGARIEDLQAGSGGAGAQRRGKRSRAPESQLALLDEDAFRQSMRGAVDRMLAIEGAAGDTVAEVKAQERAYEELRESLTRRYGRLADLVTATYFGLQIDSSLWHALADFATGRTIAALPRFESWIAEAERIAAARRFFHWELEFPEVFFDRDGRHLGERAGFDAVIGNPPYVRQEELAPLKPYFAAAFPEVYHGVADLFVYFFAQALRQLQHGGLTAYIASNSWLRANYAGPLRAYLRTHATIRAIIDLGDNRVFADAPDVYPAIHLVSRESPPDGHVAQAAVFTRGEGLREFDSQIAGKLFPVTIHDQPDSGWQLGDDAGRKVFAKLLAGGRPLGEVVNGQMYRGVLTGLNDAFIIDQGTRDRLIAADPGCESIIKPILRGEDLRPWYQENEGRWLILFPSGWTRGTFGAASNESDAWRQVAAVYPSIAEHLLPFADAARKRQDKGDYWWELRPCNYYESFEKPKIFWPDIAKIPRFSWDDSGFYLGNTGYIAIIDEPWILGFLASRCAWFLISRTSIALGERAGFNRYRLVDQYMRPLPIPDAPAAARESIGALAMAITEHARARYALHTQTRRRLMADLGTPGARLNQKLTAWWNLDFPALRAEIQKNFKRDIPLRERDDWEAWLDERRATHERLTAEIIRLETDLNARVYELFDLTPAEIAIIESSTKYRYGEV